MGSFNLHCPISRCTIAQGDRVAMIPLRKKEYQRDDLGQKSEQVYQAYPPIFGYYEDYGRMGDLQLSPYYSLWQHAGAFIAYAKGESRELPEGFDVMHVQRDAYNALIDPSLEGGNGLSSWAADASRITELVLEQMGFVRADTYEDDRRFRWEYAHPSIKTHYIASDGTWIELYTMKGKKVQTWLHHPTDLFKMFRKLDRSLLDGLTFYDFAAKDLIGQIEESLKIARQSLAEVDALSTHKDSQPYKDAVRRYVRNYTWVNDVIRRAEDKMSADKIISECFAEDEEEYAGIETLAGDLSRLMLMTGNCSNLGILLMPGLHGPKHGARKGAMQFAKRMYEIAKREYKESLP